ncbi:MAG: MATE family efflux transporter [Eubacteriales bacterium]|nr:MATE family efflux transporter [Eubacteriales bacterium]
MKYDFLDEKQRPERVIWFLAWPTILEQFLITFVQYINTAMVGALGADATASIAVTTSSVWFVNGIFAAVGIGFAVLVGRRIGEGDMEGAKKAVRQSLTATLFVGLFATLLMQAVAGGLPIWLNADKSLWKDASSYLRITSAVYLMSLAINVSSNVIRCAGDTRTPLFYNVMMNIINACLNLFLIYPTREVSFLGFSLTIPGAGLGVSGAAVSTAAAMTFTGAMLVRVLFTKKNLPICIPFRGDYKPDLPLLKTVARLGTPVAFERCSISAGQIVITAMVTGLGKIPLAAHYLAITAEAISYMPAYGFSAAATTLVSQSLGANKKALGERYAKFCTWGGFLFLSAMGVFLYFGAEFLVSLFTPDQAVVALGGSVLRVEAFAQPFVALGMVITGVLRGAGDTRWPFYISIIGMWVVRLSIAAILLATTNLGLMCVWIAMVSDLVVRGLISLWRYQSKKWLSSWK